MISFFNIIKLCECFTSRLICLKYTVFEKKSWTIKHECKYGRSFRIFGHVYKRFFITLTFSSYKYLNYSKYFPNIYYTFSFKVKKFLFLSKSEIFSFSAARFLRQKFLSLRNTYKMFYGIQIQCYTIRI